jgi:hypothetical protein
MGMQQIMTDQAIQVMERYPVTWSQIAHMIRERLHEPEFVVDLKAYSQVPERTPDNDVEWFYAIQCYTKVLLGDVGGCKVRVGSSPRGNSEMEENNATLQAALFHPFSAFAEDCHESDGVFTWSEPVKATRFIKTRRSYEALTIELSPRSAPLEIGYTHSYRSYIHLFGPEHGLARWCYGDDFIRVLRMLPHAIEAGDKIARDWGVGLLEKPLDLDAVKATVEQLRLWD